MRLFLLLLPTAAAASGAWPASFTIDQIFAAPSVLHHGLRASIPWTQHDAGRRQILREDTAASDATIALQQRLEEAIKHEDYQLASKLKEQMTADRTVVDAKVWADSPTAGGLATVPVSAAMLKRTATGVWRGIVEGVQTAFTTDLDAALSLVFAMLNRAAQMGSCYVKIRPGQIVTGIVDRSRYQQQDTDIRASYLMSYAEEWHHNDPWMLLPPSGEDPWTTHLTDGAACWAASEAVDSEKRAKFHCLCESKTEGGRDSKLFSSCLDDCSDQHGQRRVSQRLHRFRTGPASQELGAHGILSAGDFCEVAASTFSEAVSSDEHTIRQERESAKIDPFGKRVCPPPTVTQLVTVEVVDSTHGHSWVYGRTAGMLYTMRLLEHEWNRTLHTVQRFEFSSPDDLDQGTLNTDKYGGHRYDPILHRAQARKIPNFLGPIGPDQPPARPWDISRYDILLDVADRQRTLGLLTQQQHTQVSEQLVLAGRFHREHAVFESTLRPEWVDSLHAVLAHPIARKILVWKLQSAGFNVSVAAQFADVVYSENHNHGKMEVAPALEFDLRHPLPASGERVTSVDDLADFVALI